MSTPNYAINPNDERLTAVNEEKQNALTENRETMDGMISKSGQYYDNLIEETRKYGDTQRKNQQAQTDFAIEKIKQNSRIYSRKQMTWFKRDKDITWFHPDQQTEIMNHINHLLS